MSDAIHPPSVNPPAPGYYAPPPPAPTSIPGRGLGIAGFVLSFFFIANIVGLVLSIVALVQSKRAKYSNGLALAGIIIASVGIVVSIVVVSLAVAGLVDAAQTCARLGDGVHQLGNATYVCTPTSFSVTTH